MTTYRIVNELLQFLNMNDSSNRIERILWIDDKYNFCFTVNFQIGISKFLKLIK